MESDSNLERNVWIEHCKHLLKDTKFQFLYSTTMLVLECDVVRNNDAKIIIKRIITPPAIAEMAIVRVAMSVLCR